MRKKTPQSIIIIDYQNETYFPCSWRLVNYLVDFCACEIKTGLRLVILEYSTFKDFRRCFSLLVNVPRVVKLGQYHSPTISGAVFKKN